MYKKITNESYVEREKNTVRFWQDNKVFDLSMTQKQGGKEFSFYDGPPTANGKPHIGHILTRVMKDIIPRYKTMKGCHVLRKAGWDTHGLPVELEVEKLLNMDGKQDIEKYGVQPFIDKCKESVWKYTAEWKNMSDRVGYWVDMDNPYVTYDDKYIESVWWSLSEIYKKGLLYKGHKIVPYCPRCGTALSSHEVAQGYKDVEEKSAIAKFKLIGEDNTYFLAWTTTPWTLPSNVALCIHPDYDYALIESEGVKYILASELISAHFSDYNILSVKKGKEYEGTHYEPLYKHYDGKSDCYYVTLDTYVTLSDGTGVVHTAPAFGEDDARVGRKYDLPFVQMVDDRGKFVEAADKFKGVFCKDADKLILRDLKERGLLFKDLMYKHSYPFCWRCDTPLLYYARASWFIKMSAVKDKLLKNNASVNWLPPSIGAGRMGNFLENVMDWGLSRERYWGTPLPIWVCAECGEIKVVGSKDELKTLGHIDGDIELHKPYVDKVEFDCKCGHKMKRVSEVIDCWYDSGSMPFAQYHYPFENKELFESTFPADFISEAIDQTRGWFYTLLAISTLLFDKAPFKNCIVLGHVNDKNGIKMSKHKGNVVDPWSVLDKQGADAVRWHFYTSSAPWLNTRFDEKEVSEAMNNYLGTYWNTYSFYVLYADIDNFDPTKYDISKCKLNLMDKWVLSKLNSLIKFVDKSLSEYKITESARALAEFLDGVSNWYVRRSRERVWAGGMEDDKIAAYMTLYTVLQKFTLLTAPFTPFMAESVYDNIVKSVDKSAPISVHLCEFPILNEKFIDSELEWGMDKVLTAVNLGRAARNAAKIKNRQPLIKILLSGESINKLDKKFIDIIIEELNIKSAEFIDNADEYISFEAKPQLKTLGPKYGAQINKIREYLASNPQEVSNIKGVKTVVIDGGEIELSAEDVLLTVKSKEGFSAQSDKGITVVLDTTLTRELVVEGTMRELISKIQTMRKEQGFEIIDRINVEYFGKGLEEVFSERGGDIAKAVLADNITYKANDGKVWNINGADVNVKVIKV